METLKQLIDSSQGIGGFDNLLKTVSDALNVTVQQLQSNMPMYIGQGASYAFWSNVSGFGILMLILGICIGMLAFLFLDIVYERKVSIKYSIIISIVFAVSIPLAYAFIEFAKMKASPTLYLLKYLGIF